MLTTPALGSRQTELVTNVPAALIGAIGGTDCRLALARFHEGEPHLTYFASYKCASFATFGALVDLYLASIAWQDVVAAAVVAVTEPMQQGKVTSTKMAWRVSESDLRVRGASHAKVINNYTGLALSVSHLREADTVSIGPNMSAVPNECVAVIGAGAGLGVGTVARGSAALTTDGGKISLSAQDDLDMAIWRILRELFGYVSAERVLSGPGLMNVYRAMCQIHGWPVEACAWEGVVDRADAGDSRCQQVMDRFCAIYGSVAGDIALKYRARGGVFLGGDIAQTIAKHLQRGSFRARFESKGRFCDDLARIPTKIITRHDAALIGAAALAATIMGTAT